MTLSAKRDSVAKQPTPSASHTQTTSFTNPSNQSQPNEYPDDATKRVHQTATVNCHSDFESPSPEVKPAACSSPCTKIPSHSPQSTLNKRAWSNSSSSLEADEAENCHRKKLHKTGLHESTETKSGEAGQHDGGADVQGGNANCVAESVGSEVESPANNHEIAPPPANHDAQADAELYGRLTILGFRRQWQRMKGEVVEEDRNACITLTRRPMPTGMIPATEPPQMMTRGDAMDEGPGVFVYADPKPNRATPDTRNPYSVPVYHVPLLFSEEYDRYQVGRAPRGNDFVVAGRTFEEWDEVGSENGPVSRFAFRLLCERKTGKVRVFAGGFDEQDQLYIGPTAPSFHTVEKGGTPSTSQIDALVTYGLLLYKPELGFWSEVSVLYGNLYEPRRVPGVGGRQLRYAYPPLSSVASFDNVLTDGSIIVNGGTAFIWRTPKGMVERELRCPPAALDDFVRGLEQNVGACPVTLEPMDFQAARINVGKNLSPHLPKTANDNGNVGKPDSGFLDRLLSAGAGASRANQKSPTSDDNLSISTAGARAAEEENDQERVRRKPWVFTKCGHVFSEAMRGGTKKEELRCPSCRAVGPFRELLIVALPDICDGLPTHVLHPCGHAVDNEGANFWSRHIEIPRGAYEITGPWGGQVDSAECGACPFCGEVVVGQAKLYFP